MKTSRYESDLQRLHRGLQRVGIPVAGASSETFSCALSCHLYRNPDGTVRWLWPAGASEPDFLRFYHPGGRRAALFVWLVRLVFRLRLGRWLAHDRLTLYTTESGFQRLRKTGVNRWALFTGTAGPNRKLVLWYATSAAASRFLKVALTSEAVTNLHQEARALRHFERHPFRQLTVPRLPACGRGWLVQEDLGSAEGQPTNRFSDLPVRAFQELVRRDWHHRPLRETAFWQQARRTLTELQTTHDPRIPVSLLHKLERLMASINDQLPVALASAHGDCTPWNLTVHPNRLSLIDWELQQDALPALYDLFHFQYQSTILIGNRGNRFLRQTLQATLNRPEWQLFFVQNQVDPALAECLYLVHVITYYLSVYSRQTDWHTQIHWLLTTWNDALTHWLSQQSVATDRQLLLHDIAFWLHQQPYAALKFKPAHLDELPESSDLDLCLPRPVARQLTAFLREHPLVGQVAVESRSFMKQLHLRCPDGSILHLDLIWQIKRKHLEFLVAESVWRCATLAPHGLKVPHPDLTKAYLERFYGLNQAAIPDPYQALFDDVETHPSSSELETLVREMPQNQGWRGFWNRMAYGLDTLRSFTFGRGLIVTFSGVDGAGKSTVIEQTRLRIEKRLRHRVVVLRHRPSVLPILSAWQHGRVAAEQRAANTLPRLGTNQNRVSSLFRFAYYFTDYLLGQVYVQVKYVWRGYLVLYDRYYFDFIIDGRRSNISLPTGLVTSLYGLLLKPRLNIFLYAPPEEILRRKRELDYATIETLTGQYLRLFEQLQKQYPSSEYMPVLNQDLPQTLNQIFKRIQTHSL